MTKSTDLLPRPVAITVSTNYSDILPFVLDHNLDYFDHWFIVTREDDLSTREIIRAKNTDRITVLFYNFTYSDYDPVKNVPFERYFDKGGAIRLAQEQAFLKFPDHWHLVLDTDILIRSHRDLITNYLWDRQIYGPRARLDYRSLSDYRKGLIHRKYFNEEPAIIGFFQLYRPTLIRPLPLYRKSINSSWCDNEFTDLWPKEYQILLDITVDHLGYHDTDTLCTHHGRILGNGFHLT